MKLLSNIPDNIYKSLKEEVASLLLKEASELSLHQMYDKEYGADRVNKVLSIDSTPKKKFAEWVLKNVSASWFDDYYETLIVPMAKAYDEGIFQPFSYKSIETAYRECYKIELARKYENIKPVYDDGTIMIYTPQNTQELRELLEIKFRKDLSDNSWCVSGISGQDYWDKYTQDNEYSIFLIYNGNQNKLYLWNNNPNENPYHTGLLCYEFNNWGNVTCSPTDDAQLTQGAIEFLNNNSSENCTFNDVIEYINNGGSNQFDIVVEGVLGGRYNIVDNDPDSVYEHDLALVNCETGQIEDNNFCYSRFNIEFNEKNLILISNSNGGYTVAFYAPNGLLEMVGIDDEEYGAYFRGTIAIACNDGLLIYDTNTDELIDTGIKYLTPSMINFVGTEENKFIIAMDEDNEFYLIRAKNGETIFDSMYVFDWKPDRSRNCVILYLEDSYDYEEDLSYFDEVIVKNDIDEPIIEFHFDTEQCYCYIPPQEEGLDESKRNRLGNIIKENIHKALLYESQESKSIDAAKKLLMQRLGYSKEEADEFIRIKLRNDLPVLRDKNAAKFILGVTRMFLDMQIQDAQTISNLNTTLKYVASEAHINEYDRNLNDMSAQDLIKRFAKNVEMDMENDKNEVNAMQFDTPSDYEIVRIDSFEQASEYGGYTSWCVTHYENMFDSYTSDGTNQFYFCLKHGFENVEKNPTEGCPLDEYGLSMIAVCVNEKGMLNTCTCRWNHDEGGDDNIMDTKQISQVLGMNFYEVFKPNNKWNEMVENALQRTKNGEDPNEVFDYCKIDFYHNFTKVKLNERWNFINAEGDLISPNQWFDACSDFTDEFARVILNDKLNFIDTEGKLLSPNQWFDDCYDFNNGLSRIQLNGKVNFINTKGNLLSPNLWFDRCDIHFKKGIIHVQVGKKVNFINTKGNLLSPNLWFDWCNEFRDGFAVVELNEKSNYIDTEGNLLSPNWYDCCSDFKNGFAIIDINNKKNYIDTKGNLLSPNLWFDRCRNFGDYDNNLTMVSFDGKCYHIDVEGNLYELFSKEPLGINVKSMNTQNESAYRSYKNIISEIVHKLLESYNIT